MKKILVIDDEMSIREALKALLKKDYTLIFAPDGMEGLRCFQESAPDLTLLDLILPQIDGMALLKKFREIDPEAPIVMLTATRMLKTAVEAMKAGANDYLTKPFDLDELRLVIAKELSNKALHQEVQRLRTEVSRRYGFDNIIGKSVAMKEIFSKIEHLADARTTVLLLGESGVGKELVAKALHFNSERSRRPFIAINCAAIPETLLESELFGHERGAFTDAQSRRIGCFESADEGTLFLDEIADLSPSCQAKILRVLQEKKFMRVGGTELVESDVRLIAATNKILEEEVQKGRFRADLYYRINVIPIHLPPLRKRKDDIPLLVKHFLDKKTKEENLPPKTICQNALDLLVGYDWPGNIRELENVTEQMVILSSKEEIGVEDLPMTVRAAKSKPVDLKEAIFSGKLSLEQAVRDFERKIISQALQKSDHVQIRAAQLLGISRRVLKYRMDALGLTEGQAQGPGPANK